MHGVAGKPSLQEESAFLQCSSGGPIFDVARRFNAEDSRELKRNGSKCLDGFNYHPLSLMVAGKQIADIDDVVPGTCFEHPHEPPVSR